MISTLEKRAREVRARAAIRAWEYRQRKHSRGAWHRFRRVLTDAESAYAISESEAKRLLARGLRAEPVGDEFKPTKTLIFVSREDLQGIEWQKEVPLSLGPELLASHLLVLVRFPENPPQETPAKNQK